ncbi:MAG: hypothetical protein Q4P36_04650 [Bowdeniella nasicola]|nr:hypothetical protein [Bowdeniella nasicola]
MLDWLGAIPAILYAGLLLFMPGTALGAALFLPWRRCLTLAPAFSVSLIALAALGAPVLGWAWSPLPVAALTGVGVLLALPLGVLAHRSRKPRIRLGGGAQPGPAVRRAPRGSARWLPALAYLAAAALLSIALARSIGSVEAIAQSYDTSFHLNTVALIDQTGNASSLAITTASATPDSPVFYPAAWHALVALVYAATGVSIPAATNAVVIAVAALAWPATILGLARAVFGDDDVKVALATGFAATCPQFPFIVLGFGILYPNFLAYALLPAAVAALLSAAARGPRMSRWLDFLIVVGTLPGLALAQPNAVFALAVFGLALLTAPLISATWRAIRWDRHTWGRIALGWLALLAGLGAANWVSFQIPLIANLRTKGYWNPDLSASQALGEALVLRTNGVNLTGVGGLIVAGVIVLGFLATLRIRDRRWLPLAHVSLLALYAVARSVGEPLRSWLIGVWYTDPFRIAALLAVTEIMLFAAGVAPFIRSLTARITTAFTAPSRAQRPVAILLVLVVALSALSLLRPAREPIHAMHTNGKLVDEEEVAFLEEAAAIIPDGDVVANNPWDGSVLLWAIGGDYPLFSHIDMRWNRYRAILSDRLMDAATDPEVCPAAEELNVHWVIELRGFLWPHDVRVEDYDGIMGAIDSGVAEVVLERDGMRLAKLTECPE